MNTVQQNTLTELAKNHPLLKDSTLREAGVSSMAISRAVKAGTIIRLTRGLYQHPDAELDENLSLSEVAARTPKAVIVLLSALQFHVIGTQQPHSVWILLRQNAVKPRITYPAITVVKSSIDEAFTLGIDIHDLNGIPTAITNPARTVVDCFKYRNRVGLDTCIEALKDIIDRGVKPSEIMIYAKMQRVAKVMQPYIQALV